MAPVLIVMQDGLQLVHGGGSLAECRRPQDDATAWPALDQKGGRKGETYIQMARSNLSGDISQNLLCISLTTRSSLQLTQQNGAKH